jgi:hypothetical protein
MVESTKQSALLASTTALWMVAAVPLASAHGPVDASRASAEPAAPPAIQQWTTRAGVTSISFNRDVMDAAGLSIGEADFNTVILPDGVAWQAAIRGDSNLTFSVTGESLGKIVGGQILHVGNLTISTPNGEFVLGNLAVSPVGGEEAFSALWRADSPGLAGAFMLPRVKAGFNPLSQTLTIRCPVLQISPDMAAALGNPELANADLGTATVRVAATWVGGGVPEVVAVPAQRAGRSAMAGCDMVFCHLYGLYMPSGARVGDTIAVSVGTTSWNLGNADCSWFGPPQNQSPFIVWNLYRLTDDPGEGYDRFEQIGMSHIKYGFYALANTQCGGTCTFESGHGAGNWLGMGCTDTYTASLNAGQCGCGPKYELDPWNGYWQYEGSHHDEFHGIPCHSHDGIQHRCQVHDADLIPSLNPHALYFCDSFYCMFDDVDAINSFAWKPVTVIYTPPTGTYNFGMSSSGVYPYVGLVLDAWPGATRTTIAQELPIVEFESPDGRCVLAAKATDLGGGTWHYEYALMNVDMDRQVGSFSIPIAPGTDVTNVGFHAVEHHDEPWNTMAPDRVPIDNAPWTPVVTSDSVSWSTLTNPIRWSMLYNFRFDASEPPAGPPPVTLGLFRPGDPSELTGSTVGPDLSCIGDVDGSLDVGVTDFLAILAAWGPNPEGAVAVGTVPLISTLHSTRLASEHHPPADARFRMAPEMAGRGDHVAP